jgi:FAD/FMN-containing dehydrogenase
VSLNVTPPPAAEIPASAIDSFRARLRGALHLPGTPGYDESRALWNGMIDRRPAMVARCLGVADVIAGIAFAREHRLLLSIKGGGHNISGLAMCDGGLVLDLSAMRGVWVDAPNRMARAQAGCLLGDVDRETQVHGLAAVLGFVSATGISGLTLGGGFGYLTRRFGWTTDNVTGMEMVTADGRVVRANESENPELFWALRGGGGNFGVVTAIDYRLHPVGPTITGGVIAWTADRAPAVLELFRELYETGPVELTLAAMLRKAPPAPWITPEAHGTPMVGLVVCHSGSVEAGEALATRMRAIGPTIGDIVQPRPYAMQQALLDATQPKGRRYYWKSEYLAKLEPGLLDGLIQHAATIPSPHSAAILFAIGGALNQLPADHSPVGNRDAAVVLNLTSQWERAEDDAANIEWTRAAWRDLRRFSTGGTYINFLTEEETGDRIQAAYGAHLVRLASVKAQWDPDNQFRMNKNIAPAK